MVLRSYPIGMPLLLAGLAGVMLSIAMPAPEAPACGDRRTVQWRVMKWCGEEMTMEKG